MTRHGTPNAVQVAVHGLLDRDPVQQGSRHHAVTLAVVVPNSRHFSVKRAQCVAVTRLHLVRAQPIPTPCRRGTLLVVN